MSTEQIVLTLFFLLPALATLFLWRRLSRAFLYRRRSTSVFLLMGALLSFQMSLALGFFVYISTITYVAYHRQAEWFFLLVNSVFGRYAIPVMVVSIVATVVFCYFAKKRFDAVSPRV